MCVCVCVYTADAGYYIDYGYIEKNLIKLKVIASTKSVVILRILQR